MATEPAIKKWRRYHSDDSSTYDYHLGGEVVCGDGGRIEAVHLVKGRGGPRRLCDECKRRNPNRS